MYRFSASSFTRRQAIALLGTLATASLAGCTNNTSPTPESKEAKKPLVLTTFTVIQDIAANIAGDFCDVQSITKAGAEIHDYEPTPEDLKLAQKANLILNNGLGLERWFERFVADSTAERVDLSQGVTPMNISEGEYAGEANPHAWMSPANGQIYVDNIVKGLSALVPDHADDFAKNGEKYKDKLQKISSDLTEELSSLPQNQRTLVTCEGAFSYLCRDTGLNEIYLWPVNASEEGTPQQIAKVVEEVKKQQVRAVFCESTVSPKAMQQVADETGAILKTDEAHMLYVDSLSEAAGPVPTYLDLLKHDADVIVEGLTGKSAN